MFCCFDTIHECDGETEKYHTTVQHCVEKPALIVSMCYAHKSTHFIGIIVYQAEYQQISMSKQQHYLTNNKYMELPEK